MSDFGHDLRTMFPQSEEAIRHLKENSPHFRSLHEQYEQVTGTIGRIEAGLDPSSEERLEMAKKQRLDLLDHLSALIAREGAK